ncbi:hypothetical protein Y032_0641g1025 [Ancylostoma ceylanicum]|nr:hypothetical protein Y032_0641g1025 [Ancylostoma ceylanicum]
MHVFYVNLPWIIDEKDYNCSSRSRAEWLSRGSVNVVQGTYFLASGTVFVMLYVLCLIGMLRGGLLKIPCYCLMFFNGIVDMCDLGVGSFIAAYFHFIGAVFCSTVTVNWLAGHLVWSVWCGASFNCIVLAFNRIVEMIPSVRRLRFLFRGKLLYTWMAISVFYMVIRPFVTRPIPYNTVISAFIGSPMISDDLEWEISHYQSFFLPIHNVTILVILSAAYTVLCCYVLQMNHFYREGLERVQVQLFIQAFLICSTTAVASSLYIYVEFFPASRTVVIMANVVWQLSHGLHGFIYLIFNRVIRTEVFAIFRVSLRSSNFAIPNTVTAISNKQ